MTVPDLRPASGFESRHDSAWMWALGLTQIFVTLISIVFSWLMRLAYVGCIPPHNVCDNSVGYAFQVSSVILGPLTAAGVIVGVRLQRRRRRRTWWLPLCGSTVMSAFSATNFIAVLHAAAV